MIPCFILNNNLVIIIMHIDIIDIKIEENKLVTNILDKLDLVNSVNIEILGIIGTMKDNTKRPLKIKVKSISEKYEVGKGLSVLL